jgi:hypothetical protein
MVMLAFVDFVFRFARRDLRWTSSEKRAAPICLRGWRRVSCFLHVGYNGGMKWTRRRVLVALLIACVAAWLTLVGIERLYREPENYSQIEPGLWMGGNTDAPPPGTRAVLNLCEFEDLYESEVHSWKAIRDAKPAPSLEWLKEQVEFIETQRAAGRTTFVHCFQGASRSGLVVTAYLMHKHTWTRDEALAKIREKRPQLRPNPAFMELLLEWEKSARQSHKSQPLR